MNVQLPILLWTVISFCVLMPLLNRLLFKPLLAFMDARREKIDAARAKREEAQKAREAELERERIERETAQKRAEDEARAALEYAKYSASQRLVKEEKEYATLLEGKKEETEAEGRKLRDDMNAGMEELVSAFVQKLAL